jgi:hypothetical protein
MKCVCDKNLKISGYRSNGQPVALWTCPVHGNVFEDRLSEIALTDFQREVLQVISTEHKAGRSPSADDISWVVNRTVISVKRAMAVLQAIDFIEPLAVPNGEHS